MLERAGAGGSGRMMAIRRREKIWDADIGDWV